MEAWGFWVPQGKASFRSRPQLPGALCLLLGSVSSSSSLLEPGAGKSLDAVQDLALHAVLDLPPPHHQLQHLVDGVFWVLLQRGRVGEGEPAWNSQQELSRSLQRLPKPG